MEDRKGKSQGAAIPKKSKSSDLKSLYESKVSKETSQKNLKRKSISPSGVDEKGHQRKKVKKELSLSSFENADSSTKKIDDEECHKESGSKSEARQRSSSCTEINRTSLIPDENVFRIPKRKRDFVRRKKCEVVQALTLAGHPSLKNVNGHGDHRLKLSSDHLEKGIESSKSKKKKDFAKFKESRSSKSNSVQHFRGNVDRASHSLVNSGDASLKRSQKKDKKGKASIPDRVRVANEAEPLVNGGKTNHLREDDDVNLEENAAMMLSSRFDPNCTGFSSSSKASTLPSASGLHLPISSNRNIISRGSKSLLDSESASVDAANRALRPRNQLKEKGSSRKRRHFYEILLSDLDPYWILDRRIKIYWPLDQSWYLGLVNDYDEEKKAHHIKYDDREEEWISLHTEKFKLLLLPSEVPGKSGRKRAVMKSRSSDQLKGNKARKDRQAREVPTENESCSESSMDSEPIISWLARSSHQVKSPPLHDAKKRKSTVIVPNTASSLLYDEPSNGQGCLAKSSPVEGKSNLSSGSATADKLADHFGKRIMSKLDKPPIVYFRKRFRKPTPRFTHISEENHVDVGVSCSISFNPVGGGDMDLREPDGRRDEIEGPLCFTYNAGVSKVFLDLGSSVLKFDLLYPTCLVLNDSFRSDVLWLLRAVLLRQYGTLNIMWPRVHLEMLFVDNEVGLRFLIFEGCLMMATSLVFWVLGVFHHPAAQGKYIDLQLPVTSMRFTFSGVHVVKKPIVFAHYNFSRMNSSFWIYLDSKLKRHCLLSKQLHLSECTYDNIRALQNESHEYPITSIRGEPSLVKVMQKRTRPGIKIMGVSKELCQVDTTQSDGGKRKIPPFSLSFAAAPTFFLSLHLKLLMEQAVTHISYCDRALADDQEDSDLMMDDCYSTDDCSNRNVEFNSKKDMVILSKDAMCGGLPCAGSDLLIGPANCGGQILSQNADVHDAQHSSDFSCDISGGVIPNPNPTAPKSSWHHNKNSSSPLGFQSHGWSEGKADPLHNGFRNGPKKPRTQVSYSVPFAKYDFGSRHGSHHQKGLPLKRIRKANDKKSLDVVGRPEKNLEFLSCDANVLITFSDKGWRETGAQVVLELFDHNEWKLSVKLGGITRYSYKAHQFLQTGSTNRYTHAMMWKGGKDWILEFSDRSQWALFKEMHEECYNRNIRAASVKNIPIPGVLLIEENDDNEPELTFLRSSKYFRQVETDVEMALNPLHVLYDMDSEDEQWMLTFQNSENDNRGLDGISEEMLEKMMDMFEKAAYAQQCDQFTHTEIEELMVDVGPSCVAKIIYEHWQQKRRKKGMALVRHFQPPLWQRYQQQLKEWEVGMTKNNVPISNGCLDKVEPLEKPPMFAFCLKPRGLEVVNKGSSKHRSQRRISVSGHTNNIFSEQDGFNTFGRRSNGFAIGDERFAFSGHNYDSLDESPLAQTSPRVFSPRDAGIMGYYSMSNNGKYHRSKSRKFGSYMYHNDSHMNSSSPNGHQRHVTEKLDGPDLEEFKLRDPSGAARHARNMAKFKRERAQKLLHRADIAVHKAVVALMTAEAIKASSEDTNGDG
ncbi:hypothetical protein TanjilG_07907 [Lupinus angustifolius]|uniref:Enhancer of polycomb-like protein n=1 Tax=Lupinus angustifolius TaxID=3871 RepID=A0A1J7G7T1_LUPAN|nr:PREDICTED: uncharacterized protein LOC109327797 [Lupinus angustifolius]XP_019416498.1 PREDICTED: uncharacterized protein LOC109327797 [Lupinus angustifolius]OIV96515.1 hypothetical protein TanjilG_07907 [Lupinus angustifolius]